MISIQIAEAVRSLHGQGVGMRDISRLLSISRNTVRRVLRGRSALATASDNEDEPIAQRQRRRDGQGLCEVPTTVVARELLVRLYERAKGNCARIAQMLQAEHGQRVPQSTLRRWVREAGLREAPKRAGSYAFRPGEEMQHDTSPHRVEFIDKRQIAQCAGLVLAYSRRLFIQYYPRFTRFEAKQFLLQAALFMNGSCGRCMVDNTHVVVVAGSGAEAVIAPEMDSFGKSLGFIFRAHEIGHADRKAFIERNFRYVESNFLPGRRFIDFADLNAQALAWCNTVANAAAKRSLGMSPDAAYVMERAYLHPPPVCLPPVYELYERVVDISGYISLDTNRYSAPARLIGQTVTVYKYPEQVQIHHRQTPVAKHARLINVRDCRSTDPSHHPRIDKRVDRLAPYMKQLHPDSPELSEYVQRLRKHPHGQGLRHVQRLINMQRTYPTAAFLTAVNKALHYGLYDMGRLERLILQCVAGDFFALQPETAEDHDDA